MVAKLRGHSERFCERPFRIVKQMAETQVTVLLDAIERGDAQASQQLLPLVYEELHRLARQKMAHEAAEHTLQPTALVHEAYLRLVGDQGSAKWDNRGHFYAAAAEAMRRILIEAARRKASLKRGGGRVQVEFLDDVPQDEALSAELLLSLNEALQKLQTEDDDSYQLVMLRYFGGLTMEEVAAARGISERTAKRHWSFARAWLKREMDRE